jgi:hypothetical protein
LIDPLFSDISSNNAEVDLLTQTPSPDITEAEPDICASVVDDGFEDELDTYVYQTWLEENMDSIDPWKNMELEPAFQYPVEENEFLFRDINQ